MIRALPAVVAAFPDLVYFVVGATHPGGRCATTARPIARTLEREAERLGVREHVVFRDQFVTTEELCSYLQAADVFVSPYLNEAQVTSGALSYAMGAGAAVVSTPYWHAQELLADGRGRLFPFGDSAALAARLIGAARLAGGAGARARPRLRVHARVHLAARRRAATSSSARRCSEHRRRARRRRDDRRARAACPSCASITCCA